VTGAEHLVEVVMSTGFLTKAEDMYSSKEFQVKASGLDFSYRAVTRSRSKRPGKDRRACAVFCALSRRW